MEPQNFGYPALFVLVAAESAGVPVPGETALVAAAILAAMGHLETGWSSRWPLSAPCSATTSAT